MAADLLTRVGRRFSARQRKVRCGMSEPDSTRVSKGLVTWCLDHPDTERHRELLRRQGHLDAEIDAAARLGVRLRWVRKIAEAKSRRPGGEVWAEAPRKLRQWLEKVDETHPAVETVETIDKVITAALKNAGCDAARRFSTQKKHESLAIREIGRWPATRAVGAWDPEDPSTPLIRDISRKLDDPAGPWPVAALRFRQRMPRDQVARLLGVSTYEVDKRAKEELAAILRYAGF